MKYIFLYSPHKSEERAILDRIREAFSTYEGAVLELTPELQSLFGIRATPALIPLPDAMQGEQILGEDRNGKLIAEAFLAQMYDIDQQMVYEQEQWRLDNVIQRETDIVAEPLRVATATSRDLFDVLYAEKKITDEQVLSVAAVFMEWTVGTAYKKDEILRHKNQLYSVLQPVTAQAHQPPDAAGMLAIYRPIVQGHAGTAGDPIPFVNGMDVDNGKYYSYNDKKYLAKADMKPCVWNPGTAGMWQWELVA